MRWMVRASRGRVSVADVDVAGWMGLLVGAGGVLVVLFAVSGRGCDCVCGDGADIAGDDEW